MNSLVSMRGCPQMPQRQTLQVMGSGAFNILPDFTAKQKLQTIILKKFSYYKNLWGAPTTADAVEKIRNAIAADLINENIPVSRAFINTTVSISTLDKVKDSVKHALPSPTAELEKFAAGAQKAAIILGVLGLILYLGPGAVGRYQKSRH